MVYLVEISAYLLVLSAVVGSSVVGKQYGLGMIDYALARSRAKTCIESLSAGMVFHAVGLMLMYG